MTKNITVSIIIPSHNRASTIERALKSVVSQTHQNFEIIVVDDASSDNTSEILKRYSDKIRYEKLTKNSGGAVARNHGAKLAKGQYIAFLDSDDEWLSDCLEKKVALLQSHDVDGVFGDFYKCNSGKDLVRRNIAHWQREQSLADYILSGQGDCRTSTMLFTKDAFLEVLFDDNLQKHQDWDLGIRFSRKYSLRLIKEPLTIIHMGDRTRMSAGMNHKATKVFIDKHHNSISNNSLFRFFLFQAIQTYFFEGGNDFYNDYIRKMRMYRGLSVVRDIKTSRLFLFSLIMTWPGIWTKVYKLFF